MKNVYGLTNNAINHCGDNMTTDTTIIYANFLMK
jgi:hypothetical protein